MVEEKGPVETPSHFKLRRCILTTLYEIFKEYPYAVVEPRQLEEDCCVSTAEINWNMVYLEKCGLVELGKSVECPPYIASSISLTAGGIDLIEDDIEFNRRFPDEGGD
jgi:hypothetical protein